MTPVLRFDHAAVPDGHPVDLPTLLRTRALIQANSGGGKSYLIRGLLEQTHGRVPHLVLDPEGEYHTLRERFDYVLCGKDGDVPATPKVAELLCRRLVEQRASAIVDLSDLVLQDRRAFVRRFLTELMQLPRALWTEYLILLDEAHQFCPERGTGEAESTESVISLCTLGRKRGFAAVLATQRISKLHKDAAAELNNVCIGRTGLDVDVRRAADVLGMTKADAPVLRVLQAGEWFAFGPAMPPGVRRVRSAAVSTTHPDSGLASALPRPASVSVAAIVSALGDLPSDAEQEAQSLEQLRGELEATKRALHAAQRAAPAVDVAAIVADTIEKRDLQWSDRARGVLSHLEHSLLAPWPAVFVKQQSEGHLVTDPPPPAPVAIPPAVRETNAKPAGKSALDARILGAVAQFAAMGVAAPSRANVAFLAGVNSKGGHFQNVVSRLHVRGLVRYEGSGQLSLTADGAAAAPEIGAPLSLRALHEAWLAPLPSLSRRLLVVLLEAYPATMTRVELADVVGQAAQGGHFQNNLSRLSSLGAVEYPQKGVVRVADLLFPAGLR